MIDAGEKLLLTPEEAADRLSISRTQIYRIIRTGELVSISIGRKRRISVDALRTFIAQAEASVVDARATVVARSKPQLVGGRR